MPDPYNANTMLLSIAELFIGDKADLEVAESAFTGAHGDFAAKFTAAIQAHLAQHAKPEVFIEIPKDPAALRRNDLEQLVRPAADGFLRSYPSKDELVEQVLRIEYRQRNRPAWIPRVDREGRPLNAGGADAQEEEPLTDRPVVVEALRELGDVTILLPEAGDDRLELVL